MNDQKIIELQREAPLNIYQRINGIMSEAKYIEKEKKQVNGQYRFASHDAVTAKLNPLLVKYGVVVVPDIVEMLQSGNRTTCKLQITFINIDNPGDKFHVTYYGYGLDGQDKGPGKAISYAFKYAMLKTFCLETGDDPDQDSKTVFTPEPEAVKTTELPAKIVKEMTNDLLANYDVEEHAIVKKYLGVYKNLHKLTTSETLLDYTDYDKFDVDFKKWTAKQEKTSL